MRSSSTSREVFCKDFVDISHENASFLILEDFMAAAYLFINHNCQYRRN